MPNAIQLYEGHSVSLPGTMVPPICWTSWNRELYLLGNVEEEIPLPP